VGVSVLGLDCASKTGWCLVDSTGKVIDSGVQDFTKRRGESNGLMFLRFRKWLSGLLELAPVPVGLIAYEQAHFRGGAATEICVGLQTRVQEIAAEVHIESAPVKTSTLKKHVTGKGTAGKDAMFKAARKIIGRDPIDDNEADAIHVARWGQREYA
jgi:Holliday junction resolvasome RuvABC endonuclease subunit